MPPENLHLTLLFLDDQPVPALEDLHHELGRLAPAAFDLRLTGLGSFGGKAPRTLHAEAAPDPALIGLQAQIREAVRRAGIERPRTRFRPHVTLARFGRGWEATASAGWPASSPGTACWAFRRRPSKASGSIARPCGPMARSTIRSPPIRSVRPSGPRSGPTILDPDRNVTVVRRPPWQTVPLATGAPAGRNCGNAHGGPHGQPLRPS
ncbi:MAG: RNA 2',3'-cyclic phosphodiesterase [Rhodobacteraceae bacterium]|nr:RNA 2',3'-cyclic phosphodiesterase [Paracoccaceae bacterium]